MTIIFENFTDIVGKAVGGYVKIRSVDIRPGVKRSGMVTNHTIVVDLVDGHFRSPELDPGPTVITLRAGYVRKSWTINTPLEGEHELWPMVVASNEYTPEVVGQAQSAATAAAKSAAAAEASAQSTSTDRAFVATARAEVDQKVSDGAAAVRALLEDDIAATGEARDATEAARGEVMDVAATVESAITSTRWDADQLTVMGKQSQPLTGPRGARGESGPPGVPETPWVDVPLDAGVTGSVKVRRVGGVVSIRLETVTGAASRIATLPDGYAPPADARVETHLNGSQSEVASITIHASGEIHAGPRFTPQWAEVDAAWVRDGSGMFFTDEALPPEAVVPEFSSSLMQVQEHMQRAEAARDEAETSATSAAGHASTVSTQAQQVDADAAAAAAAAGTATTAAGEAARDAAAAQGSLTNVIASLDEREPIFVDLAERAEAAEASASSHATDVDEKHQQVQTMHSDVETVVNDTATVLRAQVSDEADRAEAARAGAESHSQQAITKAGEVAATAVTVEERATAAATSATNAADSQAAAESARDVAVAKAGEASTSATSATGAQTAAEAARDGARAAAIDAAHQAVAEKFADFIEGAPEMLDTWMEVVDAVQSGDTEIAALTAQLATKISGPYTIAVQAGGYPAAGTPSNQITFVTEVG